MSTATPKDGAAHSTTTTNRADGIECGLDGLAKKAGRNVRSLFESAGDEVSHMQDSVTYEIRTNPIRATAIALGVGVLLGAVLRR